MITVENVTKIFDSFTALDKLSLNVEKGSIYGLVGPNGSGKTTIMKAINFDIQHTIIFFLNKLFQAN